MRLNLSYLKEKVSQKVHIAPLSVFRVLFGSVMLMATLRFMAKGWVYDLYIKPAFYFSYYGFEWIKPLGSIGMYILFGILALSYLLVIVGYYYRIAMVTAFLTFTYIELIDKSNYLNHYYFVSLISFLLIFLPMHRYFSMDTRRKPSLRITEVPAWTIDVIKFQLALVYIFAGLAKLNYDWLFRAMPLKIWLPAHTDLPLIGGLLSYAWIAYLFSWFGAIYDIFIVFFLLNKKTRFTAYLVVIVFHVLTKILFPIGMFPYVMIFCTLIFFSEAFHKKIIDRFLKLKLVQRLRQSTQDVIHREASIIPVPFKGKIVLSMISLFFILQVLMPWRYLLYPGDLFWTEQGYRFSWRVMLMEKAGTAFFYVRDADTGYESEITNSDYLTKNQEKMMATQPDMILQYAHFLKKEYQKKGIHNPGVRVESYVTLNGSGSRLFIDPNTDLTLEKESYLPKKWILPFKQIK